MNTFINFDCDKLSSVVYEGSKIYSCDFFLDCENKNCKNLFCVSKKSFLEDELIIFIPPTSNNLYGKRLEHILNSLNFKWITNEKLSEIYAPSNSGYNFYYLRNKYCLAFSYLNNTPIKIEKIYVANDYFLSYIESWI